MDERKAFIREWSRQEAPFAALCRDFQISRQTGYKWLERYAAEGESGLEERSRVPHHDPQQMSGNLSAHDLALLKKWIDLNHVVIVQYGDGEIEYAEDAIAALKPIHEKRA